MRASGPALPPRVRTVASKPGGGSHRVGRTVSVGHLLGQPRYRCRRRPFRRHRIISGRRCVPGRVPDARPGGLERRRLHAVLHGNDLDLPPGRPDGHVGAIPLRSGTSGHVVAGFVVRPRFGWSGVGSILAHTGWHAAPAILSMPLVPGSGREVPPWVLAGPVLARLQRLLDALKRGFDFRTDTLRAPRGTIVWPRYIRESIATGRWHHVPSRLPDLSSDPILRGAVRWTLERVLQELVIVGGDDRIAVDLERDAHRLLERVNDVPRVYPRPELLRRVAGSDSLLEETLRGGLDAIGWVRDERGLGGGRQMDGLAWSMPLDRLWEHHVEACVREEVRRTGGVVRTGRSGETVTPLHWTDPSHRSLRAISFPTSL
jgi:hypothetical protein